MVLKNMTAGIILLGCVTLLTYAPLYAAEQAFDETEALIFILKQKGVISEEEAMRFLEIYTKEETSKKVRDEKRMRNQEEMMKNYDTWVKNQEKTLDNKFQEFKTEANTSSVPDWVLKIKWKGDIRTRYQADLFDDNNAALPESDDFESLSNTTRDRYRLRLRARLDMLADLSDEIKAGMRLSTGNEKDPVSTNDTLGDYFNKDGIVLDRAYLKWQPMPQVSLSGGRIENPWFCTDLVWDSDVNLEGVAVATEFSTFQNSNFFFTAGAFPLQEEDRYKDKWLLGYQFGNAFKPRADLKYQFAVAYYDYQNIEGKLNDVNRPGQKNYTSPLFMQKGNSLVDIDPESDAIYPALGSDYDELNVTARMDMAFFYPVNIIIELDFVTNIGFEEKDILKKVRVLEALGNEEYKNIDSWPEDVNGYQLAVTVGHESTKKLGEWKCYMAYKHLEADAVIDAFTDSDFHLGGTNAKGWIIGAQAGIAKNTWTSFKWISSDEILLDPYSVDLLQLDLNISF